MSPVSSRPVACLMYKRPTMTREEACPARTWLNILENRSLGHREKGDRRLQQFRGQRRGCLSLQGASKFVTVWPSRPASVDLASVLPCWLSTSLI